MAQTIKAEPILGSAYPDLGCAGLESILSTLSATRGIHRRSLICPNSFNTASR